LITRRHAAWAIRCAIAALLCTAVAHADPSPLHLDASASVPKLASDQLRVNGAAAAGYDLTSLHLAARGAYSEYDLRSSTTRSDTTRAEGYAELAWLSGDATSTSRFEVRASGGAAYYSSTYVPLVAGGGFHDEDSILGRGSLLLGGRFAPSEQLRLAFLVGGGGQYESYDRTSVTPGDPNVFSTHDATTLRLEGRFASTFRVFPDRFSMRLRVEADTFSITRTSLSVSRVAGVQQAASASRQVDVSARWYGDFDVLAIGPLVPGVLAGADVVATDESGSAVVPMVGLSLRLNEEW
jgi:hypothetical protein